jgi:TonB family protein
MMNDSKEKLIGVIATVLLHALAVLLLYFLVLDPPPAPEEQGVEVMIMEVEPEVEELEEPEYQEVPMALADASAPADPAPESQTDAAPALPVDPAPVEDPINTQEIEKSVVVKKDKPKEPKKKKPLTPEMLEKQREEAERKKREREEDLKRQAVNKEVSGAFGSGNKMKNQKDGNDSGRTKGKTGGKAIDSGKGVSFKVGNRKLGAGGLINPVYNDQAEGKVVVNVIVAPSGKVESASINAKLSNTTNQGLRNAALAAAKKTKFNEIEGVDNEQGIITYIFTLK